MFHLIAAPAPAPGAKVSVPAEPLTTITIVIAREAGPALMVRVLAPEALFTVKNWLTSGSSVAVAAIAVIGVS
ncbi:hypothetical protein D9M71_698170 [compost metagenome]